MRYLAKRLAEQELLRPGVSEASAANTMWVITSFESFDTLYTKRGLRVGEVSDILIEMAERTLCR